MEFWCQFGHRFEYCFEFGAWEAALDEEAVVGLKLCVALSRHGQFSGCKGGTVFDKFSFEERMDFFDGSL